MISARVSCVMGGMDVSDSPGLLLSILSAVQALMAVAVVTLVCLCISGVDRRLGYSLTP